MSPSQATLPGFTLTLGLRRVLEICVALVPALGIAYLNFFQDAALRFENHAFHEAAIALSTLIGGFISYVAWRSYQQSGEPFLKWLTVGFLGFTVVYSLHGFLTPLAHSNPWLFILYGPASRLVMAASLLYGILLFGRPPDSPEQRNRRGFWFGCMAVFLAICALVAVLAHTAWAGDFRLRAAQESVASALCLAGIATAWRHRQQSGLMPLYMLALAFFAQSSLAFCLGLAWNHQWWYAHLVFAAGFLLLGYGILRAYLATSAFEQVFVGRDVPDGLAHANSRLQESMELMTREVHQLELLLAAARRRNEELEALFELSPESTLLVARSGHIRRANARAERLFAAAPGGLEGLVVEELMPPEARGLHVRHRQIYEYTGGLRNMGGMARAIACQRLDGGRFNATISLSGLVYEGEPCTVAFVRDVTDLLNAENERRDGEEAAAAMAEQLAAMASGVPAMLFSLCRQGNGAYVFRYVSDGARATLECEPGDLLGNPGLWLSRVQPADLPALIGSLERSAAGLAPWQAEWRARLPHQGACRLSGAASAPQPQPDGSLVWHGWIASQNRVMA